MKSHTDVFIQRLLAVEAEHIQVTEAKHVLSILVRELTDTTAIIRCFDDIPIFETLPAYTQMLGNIFLDDFALRVHNILPNVWATSSTDYLSAALEEKVCTPSFASTFDKLIDTLTFSFTLPVKNLLLTCIFANDWKAAHYLQGRLLGNWKDQADLYKEILQDICNGITEKDFSKYNINGREFVLFIDRHCINIRVPKFMTALSEDTASLAKTLHPVKALSSVIKKAATSNNWSLDDV